MDQRYPVGKYTPEENLSEARRRELIGEIAATPAKLRAAVEGLSEQQLSTPYRDGGWTVRQVAHHLADSHMNAFIRFKLALTEDVPTIKPYEQALWAETSDAKTAPVGESLSLLESLHARFATLLQSMSARDFERRFKHPEMGELKLEKYLGLYAWHGRHHVAHITSLRERMKW